MTREEKINMLKGIFSGKKNTSDLFLPDLSKLPTYLLSEGSNEVQILGTNEIISLAEYRTRTEGMQAITFK